VRARHWFLRGPPARGFEGEGARLAPRNPMPSRKGPSTIRRKAARLTHARILELSFAALVNAVQAEVDARLVELLDAEVRSAARLAPEVRDMVVALSDLCRRGGKRLRPTLVVVGALAASRRIELDVALDAGVALELLQAYFLIHDDWMDGDAVRRGGPSVHTMLARRFKDRHKGDASAILAGDYGIALATTVLAGLAIAPKLHRPLFDCYARMQRSAVAGQQIDIIARAEDVERAYALKTGSYTVHGPLELGAILAGGSAATLGSLGRFSGPLGVAFQLRDDLLGAFGEPKKTGKPFGNDIRAGKRTALLVKALAVARGSDKRILQRVVGNAEADDAEVGAVLSIFERTGARTEVEARVKKLAGDALGALGRGVTPRGRELLSEAVNVLTERGT
jgi:geranylgeranyl diphosphate synthase, type I